MKTVNKHAGRVRTQAGFSLLELIVVLVILGLLASVVGPRVMKWGSEGKHKVATIQISQLCQGIERFRFDVSRYPSTSEGLMALGEGSGIPRWDGPYLDRVIVPKDPWGQEYRYASPGEHGDYDLWSYGADGVEGGDGENADVTSWGE